MSKTMKKAKLCVLLSAAGILGGLLAVYYLFRDAPGFARRVTKGFSQPFRAGMGRFFGLFPLSFMEVFYVLGALALLAFVAVTVVKLLRRKDRWRTLLRRVGALALAALFILTGYVWIWGIEYDAPGFQEESGLYGVPLETRELIAVSEYFLKNANDLAPKMPRDGEGHFAVPREDILKGYGGIYDTLRAEFPCLDGSVSVPKRMMFSRLVSVLGFTGFYFALTGETNLNLDAPVPFLGQTVAHELGHQLGFPSEAECNFLGVAACVTSGEPVYAYSGYLSGLVHLMNALYSADHDAWSTLREKYCPELLTDLRDNSAYWDSMEKKVTKATEKVYDAYLRSNRDELGIRSYGACVDLIAAYFGEAAHAE